MLKAIACNYVSTGPKVALSSNAENSGMWHEFGLVIINLPSASEWRGSSQICHCIAIVKVTVMCRMG